MDNKLTGRALHQHRLDILWSNPDKSLDELAPQLGCKGSTARLYQRMMEYGTREVRELNDDAWRELKAMLEGPEPPNTSRLAVQWGWVPSSFHHWITACRKRDIGLVKKAIRMPFARWGELVNHTTRGV